MWLLLSLDDTWFIFVQINVAFDDDDDDDDDGGGGGGGDYDDDDFKTAVM